MAKLYVKENEISSRITWMYTLLTKSQIEVIKIDSSKSEHQNINPLKIFPYLIDGETQIWGNHTIISYIAENYAKNVFYGANPDDKAKVNSILFWIAGSFSRCALRDYIYPQSSEANSCKLEVDSDNALLIEKGFKSTSTQLTNIEESYFKSDAKYLTNNESIVDYYLALVLLEVEKFNMKLEAWPKIIAWLNGLKPQIKTLEAQMI